MDETIKLKNAITHAYCKGLRTFKIQFIKHIKLLWCGKPFERFRIINQANNAALPNSKHNNAANPNPIKTTLGISAFSNNSAGKTSVPLQFKNK